MPNISINSVTDSVMAAGVADLTCAAPRANYIRLDRQVLPDLYPPGTDFSAGVARLREGGDTCIVATGCMTHTALKVADQLAGEGLQVAVVDLYALPVNEALLLDLLKGAKRVVTLEEHFLPGGLGSAVCEVLTDHGVRLPVKRLGLAHDKGYCYEYGGRELIRGYYGMDETSIIFAVRAYATGGDVGQGR
jgi:transketolase